MFRFHPILKSVLWGGERIAAFKRLSTSRRQIGESWEISGVKGSESVVCEGREAGLTLSELVASHGKQLLGGHVYERYGAEFPLLVKIIDAGKDLSLQVHPDDAMAARCHGCWGKTEMWHVIEAAPGAQILAGFDTAIAPADFDAMARDGRILQAVHHYDTHPGDTFYLPPGTIHSIGAGNLLAEIQQSSDVTYRVYDHNRVDASGHRRPLHIDLARQALDFGVGRSIKAAPGGRPMLACPKFAADRLEVDGTHVLAVDALDSFVVLMCLGGAATVECPSTLATPAEAVRPLHRGDTLLLPACAGQATIAGRATLLAAWVPAIG